MSADPAVPLVLGIDTGGTFTDAVLLDRQRRVVASSKHLTTRFDLAQGIGGALDGLDRELLLRVELVSLSTTLTTNSVVEGRGSPVCVLLAGYDDTQVRNSGLVDLVGSSEGIVQLAGGHDAGGAALCPLDEAGARAAIVRHAGRVSAFAISASFGVRNPEHELRLRALVESMCARPVTCGHELASSLGAPRRALTVALNARMISHVRQLIDAVQATLARRGIDAPLMLVKGDASLVNVASALARPVGTVLSGPAASVLGACALSGLQDAIVADMGGTTTDIAVVRGGLPALSFDGALIGQWRPMVEAVKIYAIGLGGDSEVRFGGGEGLVIGPRRVVPLSLLAHEHPAVLDVLRRQQDESPHPAQIRFALRLHADAAQRARLADDERAAWERLQSGPVDVERANIDDRPLSRALARLERKGMAIYSGFTPTDAAHVLGLSSHWNSEAAVLGARIWARQMRHLYGLGTWTLGDAEGPARQIVGKVIDTICQKLVEAGLNDADRFSEASATKMATLLTEMLLQGRSANAAPQVRHGAADALAPPERAPALALRFAPELPLVAVGAPAASYYPDVARALGTELRLARHAEVANAVGAVLGQVSQRVHLIVTQPQRGIYRVFARTGPQDFATVDAAIKLAEALASDEARALALAAGAAEVAVTLARADNAVRNDIDGDLFFEARVTATASGPPITRMPSGMRRDADAPR